MNNQDAANILNIVGEVNPEITKLAYRRASMKFHPDRNPAGLVMMQTINAAYETLKDFFGQCDNELTGYDDLLNDAINAIINCEGLIIEVCGNWVWLTGETLKHKNFIKEAKFKWASQKKMWYFRPEEWKSSNRQNNSMDDIRITHGSISIKTKPMQEIA